MSSNPVPPKLLPTPWHPSDLAPPLPVPIARPAASLLPAPLTSLIGRGAEVAAACAMLTDDNVRLLTLTGPGGVGKTRLAIQIGEASMAAFPDGVVFVPLTSIVDPDLVLPTIARAVGIRDGGDRALFAAVAEVFQGRRLLMILDNLEHLLEAGPLLSSLLTTCPNATFLVTSRVLLRLSGERAFPVSPLAVDERLQTAASDLSAPTSPAVQLFVERASAVEPSFTLTAENAATIATVCRQLDGLPLAIELAAARLRILSPEALLTDLEHRLRLLTDGPRDAPARQRTMHDTIAWSVDRLSNVERSLFCRLGVFVDGFTLEAAEAVAGSGLTAALPSAAPPSVLDLVASLVGQSLLRRVEQPGERSRYQMLETIRAYALSKLATSGGEASARDRHAAWCLAFAERAEPELSGPEQKAWFDRLEAEQPNMRAALHWYHSQNDAERGLRLASKLTWFWSSRGDFREARQWLEGFLALPTSVPTRGLGLLAAANILHWLDDEDQAVRYAEEALAIFRQQGDDFLTMCALRRLGSIAIDQGDFNRAARHLAESEDFVQSAGSTWDARWDAAFATYLSARLAAATGRGDVAVERFTEAIEAFRAIGDLGYVAAALGRQGEEWIKLRDVTRARQAYATSLELAIELGDRAWIARALAGVAHLAHRDSDPVTAVRLLGAATAMREAIGERRASENELALALQAAVESSRFAREWAQGTHMTVADAIAAAHTMLEGADRRPAVDERERHKIPGLTAREREVLALLADGVGDKEIGVRLSISRRTASQHVAAILSKLEVESRTAAVSVALRQGLLGTSTANSA